MAKRKKIVINQSELASTTLATKADSKKSSILGIVWLFLIFAIFIVGVKYLPEISMYVNSYLNPETPDNQVNKPSNGVNNNTEDNEESKEEKRYKITEDLKIEDEKITISNIKVNENKIVVDIANNTKDTLNMNKEDYFLNLFDANNKLLQRIILNEGVIAEGSKITLDFDLTAKNVVNISLIKITPNEYPAYTVLETDDGAHVLKCNKNNEVITYYFSDNKALIIEDVFEVALNDPNYAMLYNNYSIAATTYSNINGVTSLVSTDNNFLIFRTTINLSTFKEGTLNNKIIFAKDTDAKIIKFELEASGYTCK